MYCDNAGCGMKAYVQTLEEAVNPARLFRIHMGGLFLSYTIPAEKISEIKHASDILEIISEYVILKKSGRNYLGLCPFHSEKTPSFTVTPDKQMFYCFGCGEGGNVFSFIMKQEGLAFPEAVRFLAKRCQITIPEYIRGAVTGKPDERDALLQINQQAMTVFHNVLLKTEDGATARAYLKKRGIPANVITDFRLGYALPGWNHLTQYFSRQGTVLDLVEKAGLIARKSHASGYYDRFRDRVIFPIFNSQHQAIAFGGRVMDTSLPKYLNSPETPLYSKSKSLYGFDVAKPFCRQTGEVFVAEGYMDLLSLHLHGIQNSAATLGTAMTEEHIRLLKGVCDKIILVFDSDQAGIKAAQRCIELFRLHHQPEDIRILVLPEGEDPDTYLQKYGTEAFKNAAAGAYGVFSFLIDIAVKKHGLSLEGKLRVVQEMEEPLSSLTDTVVRSSVFREISERTGIDESAIQEKFRSASHSRTVRRPSDVHISDDHLKFEKRLIAMLLQFPEIIPEVIERNLIETLSDPLFKSVAMDVVSCFNRMKQCPGLNDDLPSLLVIDTNQSDKKKIIAEYSIQREEWRREGCLKLMDQYEIMQKRRLSRLLQQKIKAAEESHDDRLLQQLLKDFQMITRPQEAGNYGKTVR